jgi:hydroxymethylglutaryl-CoA reductase
MQENKKSSSFSGFYKLSVEKRIALVKQFADLTDEEIEIFSKSLDIKIADRMIENVLGTFEIPLGVAVNFVINDVDMLIPMVSEESSVVAAASNAAKIAKLKGGFKAEVSDPLMIGQIQILNIDDITTAVNKILQNKQKILDIANAQDKILVNLGGGAKDLEVRILNSDLGKMIVIHLIVDVKDAMGANAVNTMVEALSPVMEDLTGGYVR